MFRMVYAFVFVCLLYLVPATAEAAWPYGGLRVSAVNSQQEYPHAAPDGSGGVLAVWRDLRTPANDRDVYAQRIDVFGNPMWGADGTPVAALADNQPWGSTKGIDVIPNGSGGAFVVWDDDRNGNTDIYAQQLDANGSPLWVLNGVPVVTDPAVQDSPRLIGDGAGGIIVVWEDQRNGNDDLFAQRLDGSGAPQWTVGGAPVVVATVDQYNFSITSGDGSGAIVAWQDTRGSDTEVYAQKLDGNGVAQWALNGVLISNSTDNDASPKVVGDGGGGAFVVWSKFGVDDDVLVRRIDSGGALPWNPLDVTYSDFFSGFDVTDDGTGGVVVTWSEDQDDSGDNDAFAQRVTAFGNKLWTGQGVKLASNSATQINPMVVTDGGGGATVLWKDNRSGTYEFYGQRVSSNGLALWYSGGVFVSSVTASNWEIAPGAGGDAYVVWESSLANTYDIYAQRVEPRYGGWGYPEPAITSVADVPGDQGGQVAVNWLASDHDALGVSGIDYYSIWRAVDAAAMTGGPNGAAPRIVTPDQVDADFQGPAYMEAGGYYFEWLENRDAFQLSAYSYSAATRNDSVGSDNGLHYFQVIAHDYNESFVSQPDSGYSVDNLSPEPAMMLTASRIGGDDVELDWSPSGENEADFADYVIYRGESAGVPPTPVFYLSDTPDTTAIDGSADESKDFYYIVTARDIHGNESPPTGEAMVEGTATGIDDRPPALTSLQIRPNTPNPFTRTTTLSVGLPSATSVSLEVYDVAGRRVMGRDLGRFGPGWQEIEFTARDATGRMLPNGVYFYRVEAADAVETDKMMILR